MRKKSLGALAIASNRSCQHAGFIAGVSLSEFNLIERYFKQHTGDAADVTLGIGDDCALLRVPAGMELAVSIDTLVADVHFARHANPFDIGHKALAVNLSDLAAMGAEPRWATLALTLPEVDEDWLCSFSSGFFALAERYRVRLVGGDTTRGPLAITVQIHGLIPEGQALRRNAAQPGDLIYVTGELGDAGLALAMLQGGTTLTDGHAAAVLERLHRPQARVAAGLALRGIANAAIDLSDGLAADLGHVLKASGVGATIYLERLPLSAAVSGIVTACGDWSLPLSAGDDYELCFTVPKHRQGELLNALEYLDCTCTCIGAIEETPGLRCKLHNGELVTPSTTGYQHFK